MKKVIAVFGQMGMGKDVVANYLVKKLNDEALYYEDKWRRIGFADAVKHVYMQSFDTTWEFIEEWKRKDEIPPGFDTTVRKSLQQIGDGFRKIQHDVWIRTALRNKCNMVISDGRYINEAKMIKEHGGINILLWRPGFENDDPNPSESQIRPFVDHCARNQEEGPMDHYPTRMSDLGNFDYFLVNDSVSLEDFYSKIDNNLIPFIEEKLK